MPARVVVLKTSRFRPEEAEGIDAALKKFGIEMADLLWVQESSPIAVFRDGNYPVLRGTFVDLNGKGLLYTRGSVPYYGTYPGLRVPRPLLLVPHENTDSTILTLAKDVRRNSRVGEPPAETGDMVREISSEVNEAVCTEGGRNLILEIHSMFDRCFQR